MKIKYIIHRNSFNNLEILNSYICLFVCGSINVATFIAECAAFSGSVTANAVGYGRGAV